MPTTRRSTAGRGARGQSTISFQNKITKPLPSHAKKATVTTTPATKAKLPASPPTEPDVVEIEPEKEIEQVEITTKAQAPTQSDSELKASKVTDAQIKKYWKSIEEQRIAPRVHQGDLSQSEKILRYFDVSSQYGTNGMKPCVGMTRTKRWYRADRLGLQPPIEVLAVLLKEDKKKAGSTETAHIDRILNSGIAVGA